MAVPDESLSILCALVSAIICKRAVREHEQQQSTAKKNRSRPYHNEFLSKFSRRFATETPGNTLFNPGFL
jgi:hypothetical protein